MKAQELRRTLEQLCSQHNWQTKWKKDEEKLEVYVDDADKPFEIKIPLVLQRIQQEDNGANLVINDVINQIKIVVESMQKRQSLTLTGHDKNIFPVMRSAAFPKETKNGKKLITEEHTAESHIYYALDLGKSYTLIDETMVEAVGWSKQQLKEKATFNLRGLSNEAKKDSVAGNDYYFISPGDGYAASRILNQPLIEQYAQSAEGEFCAAIPHQDVLILADVKNDSGYDVLGQMVMHFYRNGDMPITALPFQYKDGVLEPIFILAKRKPQN